MKNPRPILKAFRAIKNLESIGFNYGIYATTPDFFIRVLGPETRPGTDSKVWKVQFAWRKTFDRWSNSTNFETEIQYEPYFKNTRFPSGERRWMWIIPDLNLELAWCKHVAESGIYHFNTYFSTVKTPRFIYTKLRDYENHYKFLK